MIEGNLRIGMINDQAHVDTATHGGRREERGVPGFTLKSTLSLSLPLSLSLFSCGEYFYETKTSTFTFKELKTTSSENKFLKFKFSFFTTSLLWLSPFKGYNLTFATFLALNWNLTSISCKVPAFDAWQKVTWEIFDNTITSCHDWGVKVY